MSCNHMSGTWTVLHPLRGILRRLTRMKTGGATQSALWEWRASSPFRCAGMMHGGFFSETEFEKVTMSRTSQEE